jgi:hypothetical protein
MDSLLRLVRRYEPAFWELVEEKAMSAEVAPLKADTQVATIGTSKTNVVLMSNFRDAGFTPSIKTPIKFPAEAKKWK